MKISQEHMVAYWRGRVQILREISRNKWDMSTTLLEHAETMLRRAEAGELSGEVPVQTNPHRKKLRVERIAARLR